MSCSVDPASRNETTLLHKRTKSGSNELNSHMNNNSPAIPRRASLGAIRPICKSLTIAGYNPTTRTRSSKHGLTADPLKTGAGPEFPPIIREGVADEACFHRQNNPQSSKPIDDVCVPCLNRLRPERSRSFADINKKDSKRMVGCVVQNRSKPPTFCSFSSIDTGVKSKLSENRYRNKSNPTVIDSHRQESVRPIQKCQSQPNFARFSARSSDFGSGDITNEDYVEKSEDWVNILSERVYGWLVDVNENAERPKTPSDIVDDGPVQTDTAIHVVHLDFEQTII